MSTTSLRILVIEDEKSLSEIYKELLESSGYEVETAADGERGLSAIQKGKHDLILLDILMPKYDGLQVLKLLTPEDFARNGPIVVLTQLGQESITAQALKTGAAGCIVKADVDLPGLLAKVREFLKEK